MNKKEEAEKRKEQYIQFMYNKDNILNCEACPENNGMTSAGRIAGPCGQQNCWVAVHCCDHY